MEPEKLTFSVVIPTHNRKGSLLTLLEQLRAQPLPRTGADRFPPFQMDIIVIDDGSSDGTGEALRENFPGVTVIEGDGNWWWTRSVNEGCRRAITNGSNAVLLLNDDVRLEKFYLKHLLEAVQKEPEAIVGSLNTTDENRKRLFFTGAPSYHWWFGKVHHYHEFLSPYEEKLSGLHHSVVMPGRGLWIPAGVFDQIGFFDQEHLPQYKADYDFVLRAFENGIKTLISWDSEIQVHMDTTGHGATFTRGHLHHFIGSFFKKHSRTSIGDNLFYYFRHYPVWALPLLPVTGLIVTVRQLRCFFKTRKY